MTDKKPDDRDLPTNIAQLENGGRIPRITSLQRMASAAGYKLAITLIRPTPLTSVPKG
jgi:hypothetical protein